MFSIFYKVTSVPLSLNVPQLYDSDMARKRARRTHGSGGVVLKHGSFHLRYWAESIIDGHSKKTQKSVKLCDKDDVHFSTSCDAVKKLAAAKLAELAEPSQAGADVTVVSFWETTYLPFVEQNLKPSTVSGYKQIWSQHLKAHFGTTKLPDYRTSDASRFLVGLAKTLGLRTLNHVRSLASGIFSHAVNIGLLETNPLHGCKILGKTRQPQGTKWYTLEDAENVIGALIDHVDAQLVMSLACFLGLRPGEISGLQWGDFDENYVHIRRAVVRGRVGTLKTPESAASLPLIAQVKIPLALWWEKSGQPTEGWVFSTANGTPLDLRDMVARTIRPVLKSKNIEWKSLYAGRRGAGTLLIGLTNGNYAAAQELLRHKHMSTTLQFYKKQTQSALSDGLKALEAAATAGSTGHGGNGDSK
jgi:integrase